jgi:alpha-tubulin suppressor-like RCC1 family protein
LGLSHTCALRSNGLIACWGNNVWGQLGDNSTTTRRSPVTVAIISTATEISSGYQHMCARLADQQAMCWGYGPSGQLGNNGTFNADRPYTVFRISNAVSISAGGQHSCASLATGAVQCWGRNHFGQLSNEAIDRTSSRPVSASVDGGPSFAIRLGEVGKYLITRVRASKVTEVDYRFTRSTQLIQSQ